MLFSKCLTIPCWYVPQKSSICWAAIQFLKRNKLEFVRARTGHRVCNRHMHEVNSQIVFHAMALCKSVTWRQRWADQNTGMCHQRTRRTVLSRVYSPAHRLVYVTHTVHHNQIIVLSISRNLCPLFRELVIWTLNIKACWRGGSKCSDKLENTA